MGQKLVSGASAIRVNHALADTPDGDAAARDRPGGLSGQSPGHGTDQARIHADDGGNMPADTMSMVLFWGIAAGLSLGVLGLIFAPLLRGGGQGAARASYDMQVFRDQLREIDADHDRGLMSAEEARATRVEVSRRLIAAADSAASQGGDAAAPRSLSRALALTLVLLLALAGGGLYARLGAPGSGDRPLAARLEADARARAERPGQAEVEAMVAARMAEAPDNAIPPASPEDIALIDQLRGALAQRPDDLAGHRLLARSLGTLGQWSEARAAQGTVIRLLGPGAGPADLMEWAELMVLATNGYVSPEAEAALGRALALDPTNAPGRYYSGLALLQGGRADLAYRLWTGLLAEGPADAPWIPTIEAQIDEVARLAGMPPPAAGTPQSAPLAGPAAGDIAAAEDMSPEDRAAMIEGMVAGLDTRLSAEGGTPEEWARLIGAYGVLGRMDDAARAWQAGKTAHAGDAPALTLLDQAARGAGLIQ